MKDDRYYAIDSQTLADGHVFLLLCSTPGCYINTHDFAFEFNSTESAESVGSLLRVIFDFLGKVGRSGIITIIELEELANLLRDRCVKAPALQSVIDSVGIDWKPSTDTYSLAWVAQEDLHLTEGLILSEPDRIRLESPSIAELGDAFRRAALRKLIPTATA